MSILGWVILAFAVYGVVAVWRDLIVWSDKRRAKKQGAVPAGEGRREGI